MTIDNALPLGLHPSPMLANLVCLNLDDDLQSLADKSTCRYTRYADDLTFSSDEGWPDPDAIASIVEAHGFKLNPLKTRRSKIGQSHYVTGLSVSDDRYPRIPKRMKKRLRQELYFCEKFGIYEHLDRACVDETTQRGINRIDGCVKYVSHVEREIGKQLSEKWQSLLLRDGMEPSFETIGKRAYTSVRIYFDESELRVGNSTYLALGVADILDEDEINTTTEATLRQFLADPFSGGRKKNLSKRKLHFTDAPEDLRKEYLDKLSVLPFNGYLAYSRLQNEADYVTTYLALIQSLLRNRLMACDGSHVELIFEQNPKIPRKDIEDIVNHVFEGLQSSANRRPHEIVVKIGSKTEYPCFSIPDFLLGVWGQYAKLEDHDINARYNLLFEKIRDKYRVIFDVDHNIIYSRKRPFLPFVNHTIHIKTKTGAD